MRDRSLGAAQAKKTAPKKAPAKKPAKSPARGRSVAKHTPHPTPSIHRPPTRNTSPFRIDGWQRLGVAPRLVGRLPGLTRRWVRQPSPGGLTMKEKRALAQKKFL